MKMMMTSLSVIGDSVNSCIMYGGWGGGLLIGLYIAMPPHTTFCIFYNDVADNQLWIGEW